MAKKRNLPRLTIWDIVIGLVISACALLSLILPPTPTPYVGAPPELLTLFVSLNGNDSNDCLSEETACQSLCLWGAIRKSRPYSTILVGPGKFGNTFGTVLQVAHSMTIRGAGRDQTGLVSERPSDNMMVTRGVEVTISDLTLGRTPEVEDSHGAGLDVRDNDAVVTLENCRVRDTFRGIMLISGSLTIQNCIVEENVSGIIVLESASLTLIDSVVRNNALTSGAALSNSGITRIENTRFTNNAFSSGGGASASISNRGELEMNGVRVLNSGGNGIVLDEGRAIMTGISVENRAGTGIWHIYKAKRNYGRVSSVTAAGMALTSAGGLLTISEPYASTTAH